MDRCELLEEAKRVITGAREDIYGKCEDSFKNIASYWSTYLKMDISKIDVANMMILLKVARMKKNSKYLDNYIDIVGYAANAAELAENLDENAL